MSLNAGFTLSHRVLNCCTCRISVASWRTLTWFNRTCITICASLAFPCFWGCCGLFCSGGWVSVTFIASSTCRCKGFGCRICTILSMSTELALARSTKAFQIGLLASRTRICRSRGRPCWAVISLGAHCCGSQTCASTVSPSGTVLTYSLLLVRLVGTCNTKARRR